ncbi:MAG TPA: UbiA family prenyltransferase [Sphingobacteriaceae bacterium]|nr:UbiA family prenyltransferase [Sphingobacteriaceae bacterium]
MILKSISKLGRVQEWWEHKLPAVLTIGYATSLSSNTPLIELAPWLAFVLTSIIVGAIYVSTINDITDIDEDLASSKNNRMSIIPKQYRWFIPCCCIAIGMLFFYSFLPDKVSAYIYILPWISFSLYSFKPFRLKHRGIWGLFADASGAHLFIGLLMVSSVSYASHQSVDAVWFALVGIWSLCFGLRGILWHQYYDRHNDLKVLATTFATEVHPDKFKTYEKGLIAIELLAFGGMVLKISLVILLIFLILYVILVILRYRVMGHKPVIVINPPNLLLQILMLDFYQVFFPLGVLLFIAFNQQHGWILLVIHIILFPRMLINILKDSIIITKSFRRPFQTSNF